ncbi:MAG: hypothetical protein KKD35_02965, partial [Elusimicrobia bacterium]|nr:hypothetical protein [Elusimicrobiota bacterium]
MNKIYTIFGRSMNFFLEPGDKVKVEYCNKDKFSIGDMLLLIKWKGNIPEKYIVHRLLFKGSFFGKDYLLTKGDSVFSFDYPLSKYQAAGKVIEVFKFGKWAHISSLKTHKIWFFGIFYSLILSKLVLLNMLNARYLALFMYLAFVKYTPFKKKIVKIINSAIKLFDLRFRPFFLKYIAYFLFCLDADLFKTAAMPPLLKDDKIKTGRLTNDEVWSGDILLSDYLIIDKGVKITALPGTFIRFEQSAPWFFPVFRAGLKQFEEL